MKTTYKVENVETRVNLTRRHITYVLDKDLPAEWPHLTTDGRGEWLNENAEFIKDSFDEPDEGDMHEETVLVEVVFSSVD